MANHEGPMACPVDGTTLVMSERSGIEIDYCPTCRGVWLDRGELDKIIARAMRARHNSNRLRHRPSSRRRNIRSPVLGERHPRSTDTATATSRTRGGSRSWKTCSTRSG